MTRPKGPFGVDPLYFTITLFSCLLLFVLYLLLPRAMRKQYFASYPKRHAWSARSRGSRRYGGNSLDGSIQSSTIATGTTGTGSIMTAGQRQMQGPGLAHAGSSGYVPPQRVEEEQVTFSHPGQHQQHMGGQMSAVAGGTGLQQQSQELQQNEEIVISAAMQQLRDPGVLIVAHGSRGKPKTVRLQLTESAVTWRTETRKKTPSGVDKPKLGKLHQVPLAHIMYVDVGKQTTALRRVENASVSDALCFSLLTKEGSLDLEANSPRERDALVSCFSLVLDEVHAQNWRDIYRGPSSDMPSSFDELDPQQQQMHLQQQQQMQQQQIQQQQHHAQGGMGGMPGQPGRP